MIRSGRDVVLAIVSVVVLIAVSFGVGWFVSGSDDRTSVRQQPAVAQLRPLPVPHVIIPNGPWADPRPTAPVPVQVIPRIPRGLFAELFWLLGLDPAPGSDRGQS